MAESTNTTKKRRRALAKYSPSREDDWILSCCAGWQQARAEALLTWAKTDKETIFGTIDDDVSKIVAPHEALQSMQDYLSHLSQSEPNTVRGAREMLDVVLLILTHREIAPLDTLATGPIIAMVRNVWTALTHSEADLGLGTLAGRDRPPKVPVVAADGDEEGGRQ